MNGFPTFVELLEELSKRYRIDALGMSIDALKLIISEEDRIRLDYAINPPDRMRYRITAYIEIEVSTDTEAMVKTTRIMREAAKGFDETDRLLDVDLKDITEGE